MAKNRKAAEKVILNFVQAIDPSGQNKAMLQEMLTKLTDNQFDNMMEKIRAGEYTVPITIPNNSTVKITVDNNLKVAENYGINFFPNVEIVDPDTGVTYLSPIKYMVLDMPVRRQIETLESKMSVAEHNTKIDALTGQPVSSDKGGSLSFPEILVLTSNGFDASITEAIKVRGGDSKAYNYMVKSINETGQAKLENIERLGTRPKATMSLQTLLTAMHYKNNL